jgi:hypothetical protein
MKKITLIILSALTILACQDKKNKIQESKDKLANQTEQENTQPWITLFDGTSYDNWRGYLSDSIYPEWAIEDNAMAYTPGDYGGKNIITKQEFTNFILSLEWKISEGGNSGIFWSVKEDPKYKEAYQTGPEIQVLDNERHPDAKINGKLHQAGALYDMIEPSHDVAKPAGEWNTFEIKIDHRSNKGSVTLNDTEIVTFPVHGEEWDKMVANSKFRDWEGFGKHQTGHIGLQDHGNKVWYRNIKIKELN